MKAHLSKKGRVVLPISQAVMFAATGGMITLSCGDDSSKSTTYKVTLASGSQQPSQLSTDNGPAVELPGTLSGGFQMIVDAKGKVVIPKETFEVSRALEGPGKGYIVTLHLSKDAEGKLGGDVDVNAVLSEEGLEVKIGDGTKDQSGSLVIVLDLDQTTTGPDGKVANKGLAQMTYTTGKAIISVKGSKSGLEGKSYSGTGAPLNLDAGTGKLVGILGSMNEESSVGGLRDTISFGNYNLQIAKSNGS